MISATKDVLIARAGLVLLAVVVFIDAVAVFRQGLAPPPPPIVIQSSTLRFTSVVKAARMDCERFLREARGIVEVQRRDNDVILLRNVQDGKVIECILYSQAFGFLAAKVDVSGNRMSVVRAKDYISTYSTSLLLFTVVILVFVLATRITSVPNLSARAKQ